MCVRRGGRGECVCVRAGGWLMPYADLKVYFSNYDITVS